jgi:dolichol-phosphate mannosyltransferase
MDARSTNGPQDEDRTGLRVPAELAIIVPTFNEVRNIPLLVNAVAEALPSIGWELVFVDDNSPDGTAREVRRMAMKDARIRIVHRYGRRGLSSACVEGIMATAAPIIAVMDGDMQHDERMLAQMFDRIGQGDVDLVIGSRFLEGGFAGAYSNKRLMLSRLATKLATKLVGTPMSDPMSGYFMMTRDAFMESLPRLSSIGFKILLDVTASAPKPLRIAETPFQFRGRAHGESKLDTLVVWEFAQLLLDKTFGHIVPTRFLSFVFVGSTGLVVHFAVLTFLFELLKAPFWAGQAAATLIATSSNFFLNNILTYRDQRLSGRRLFTGWLSFNLVCAIGALGNVGVANWLFEQDNFWAISALAGIAITTVWNYAMSSIFTWGRRSS